MSSAAVALTADALSKTFVTAASWRSPRRSVEAVREVSLEVEHGTSVGLVGESGSGKTTLARMLIGIEHPSGGRVLLDGEDSRGVDRRSRARRMQMVFQDPYTSLDGRQTPAEALDEAQRVHFGERSSRERRLRTEQLLEAVGIGKRESEAPPSALSGGQRQRVAIARALVAEPKLLILDEAVSALDVSVQAQILNLLTDLREQLSLTYLMISHDLAVVRQMVDTVIVMYRGIIVETGPVEAVLDAPQHPYTRALRAAVPEAGKLVRPRSAHPNGHEGGCPFRQRCELAAEDCAAEPPLESSGERRKARCWRVKTTDRTGGQVD